MKNITAATKNVILNNVKDLLCALKSSMAIGLVVFCCMMMSVGSAWCGIYNFVPPNGALIDTSTGLVWLQNANCFGMKNWQDAMNAAASLKSGSCGLTDGSTVGQWRLPTKDELVARQKNQQGFINVQSGYYWSGSTFSYNTTSAWFVGMSGGYVVAYGIKTGNFYVWPVRSGQ